MSDIVFCEDDPSIRKLIAAATRGSPHAIHMASDGADGLALIERIRPDAIFADVAMPVMTGLELAERLRASADLRSIPFVFMTASVQRDELEKYGEITSFPILTKPFTIGELRLAVADVLGEAVHGG